jgi:tetratricopeptide (TPR) repeat protein
MGTARLGWSSALTLSLLLLALPAVAVEGGADAREIYEQATAAFGLGHYAAAAEKYEAAFSLRPDPALLYNAAQSYRLAGNKPRALELYRNCLRLYPNFHNAEDARRQVTNLKAEIEQEQSAKTATAPVPPPVAVAPPPVAVTPPPVAVAPPPVASLPPAAPVTEAAASSSPVLLDTPAPAPATEADRPLTSKAWFWGAIGAVVVGGTVALLLATRGTSYPAASFGTVNGN